MPTSPHTLSRHCAPTVIHLEAHRPVLMRVDDGRDRPRDGCNGNCDQGRACDCVPDAGPQAASTFGNEDAGEWSPLMSSGMEWLLIGCAVVAALGGFAWLVLR